MLTQDVLNGLATAEPKRLVISVHARTDPRDPVNTGSSPAWLIQLRNGLRAISERLEAGDEKLHHVMLAIAQALVPEPRVLMLDEPSAGLAPIIVSEVLTVISDLRAEGIGILLVEQLVDAALEVADHVTVISRGRMAWSGPRAAVGGRQDLLDAYLDTEPGLPAGQ